AHELTHVVQQGTAEIGEVSLPIGPTDHPAEREADAAADAVLHNRLASGVGKAETPRLLRVPAPEAPQSPDSGEPADHRRLDEPLPYREATELATCNRIMGPGSEEYCRQQVLGEQPPPSPESPSVEIRSANLATGVGLRFGPAGTTGTLNLDLTGAGPSYRVATGPRNAGTTNENFNVPTLPIREFTGLRATWTVNGSDFVDTRAFHIQVLGIFRHSQYNVPNENSCGGAPVHAYLTDSHCHFAPIMLRSGFIAQANLNGSGVSMTHGNVVRENVCLGNPAAPADAANRSFRSTGAFRGACGALSNNTVANCRTRPDLHCGDRVFIHTQGIKTITDFCPACCGHNQLDNFTTASACAGIGDLCNFVTVKLF